MKKTLLTAISLMGFAAMTNISAAQLTSINTYNQGDLLIGITANGAAGSTDLLVNLGSSLTALNGGYFDISSALTSTYGANWATLSGTNQLKWGVVSASYDADADTYTSFASAAYNQGATVFGEEFHYNAFGAFANTVDLVSTGFVSGTKFGGASRIAASFEGSWTKVGSDNGNAGVDTFSFFSAPVSSLYSINAGNGENWLDIYSTVNGGGMSTYSFVNTIALESNGQVTVVPEPSTYALLGFGALLLLIAYRRSNA
jgi:hypothetical protein